MCYSDLPGSVTCVLHQHRRGPSDLPYAKGSASALQLTGRLQVICVCSHIKIQKTFRFKLKFGNTFSVFSLLFIFSMGDFFFPVYPTIMVQRNIYPLFQLTIRKCEVNLAPVTHCIGNRAKLWMQKSGIQGLPVILVSLLCLEGDHRADAVSATVSLGITGSHNLYHRKP